MKRAIFRWSNFRANVKADSANVEAKALDRCCLNQTESGLQVSEPKEEWLSGNSAFLIKRKYAGPNPASSTIDN